MDLIRIGAFDLYPSARMLCAAGKPDAREHLDEVEACSLALGLRA
jgi:hypothetical protein